MPKLLFETAGREVNKRLKKARVLLQQGNPQSYNEEVLKAISEYLEHKLNTPKAHFSLDRALVQLQEHNVTAGVREKLKFWCGAGGICALCSRRRHGGSAKRTHRCLRLKLFRHRVDLPKKIEGRKTVMRNFNRRTLFFRFVYKRRFVCTCICTNAGAIVRTRQYAVPCRRLPRRSSAVRQHHQSGIQERRGIF